MGAAVYACRARPLEAPLPPEPPDDTRFVGECECACGWTGSSVGDVIVVSAAVERARPSSACWWWSPAGPPPTRVSGRRKPEPSTLLRRRAFSGEMDADMCALFGLGPRESLWP